MSYRTETDVSRRTYLKLTGGASAVGLSGVAGCLGESGGDGATITPGTAPGFPPFEMQQDGELVGFDVDLLEAVVGETEYEIDEWATFEFDGLIPALTQNEEIDVIAAAMTITEDRQETIAFSDPYWESDQAILVREGGDFQPSEWADFEGARVGAQSGTTGADVVESNLVAEGVTSEDNFSTYDSYVLAVEDLANENIDAVVVDNPVAETFAAERDVTIAFIEETGERFGFGLRQGESELQSALNDGLATVRDGGTYQEITNTWFGQE
jgi:polar amino acid transport system substrate-binding protein